MLKEYTVAVRVKEFMRLSPFDSLPEDSEWRDVVDYIDDSLSDLSIDNALHLQDIAEHGGTLVEVVTMPPFGTGINWFDRETREAFHKMAEAVENAGYSWDQFPPKSERDSFIEKHE